MPHQVFSLNIHANYRCHNSGECCSLAWDVPMELPVYRSLDEAIKAGRLTTSSAAGSLPPFIVEPDLPEGVAAIFQRTAVEQCVFFEPDSRLCIVHRDLGADALAATCRNFPRLSVQDRRGTFVTLSHFCPTAASLLFADEPTLSIVASPPAFPSTDYDGLAVGADDLPPLLHPRMLMDLEAYDEWERHMVSRCADLGRRPESVLATLARDARLIAAWSPADGETLAARIRALPSEWIAAPAHDDLAASWPLQADVMAAMPDDLRPEADDEDVDDAYASYVRPVWDGFSAPLNRYLAGKAFASWTAYQGKGVATIVRGLEAALALVRIGAARLCRDADRILDAALLLEAFRAADFELNHLAVGEELAAAWSSAEEASNTAITGP